MQDYTFYTDKEYRHELIRLISQTKKGDRILLMSMGFEPIEPEIAHIIEALEHAAVRGVQVLFSIDAHTFMLDDRMIPGPLFGRKKLPRKMPKIYANKLDFIERLNAYPTAQATILNMPRRSLSLPVAGRSHIKAVIINDQIFLGGCNLEIGERADIMIGWRDHAASERLYTILKKIMQARHSGRALSWVDRSFAVDSKTEILIDAGQKGQSVILDEAIKLINASEKWLVITCQYFPNSVTAYHLLKAMQRGVKVEIVYAHPSHHWLIGGLGQHFSILREKARLPRALFEHGLSKKDPLLHAKMIASDKGLMIGSHNYVKAGVKLGTAEIALKSSNEKLAKEAVKTVHRSLGRE